MSNNISGGQEFGYVSYAALRSKHTSLTIFFNASNANLQDLILHSSLSVLLIQLLQAWLANETGSIIEAIALHRDSTHLQINSHESSIADRSQDWHELRPEGILVDIHDASRTIEGRGAFKALPATLTE